MRGTGEPDEVKVASLKQQLNTNLDVYEKILTKQPYLAGEVSIHVLVRRFDGGYFQSCIEFYVGRFISFAVWCMAR